MEVISVKSLRVKKPKNKLVELIKGNGTLEKRGYKKRNIQIKVCDKMYYCKVCDKNVFSLCNDDTIECNSCKTEYRLER